MPIEIINEIKGSKEKQAAADLRTNGGLEYYLTYFGKLFYNSKSINRTNELNLRVVPFMMFILSFYLYGSDYLLGSDK